MPQRSSAHILLAIVVICGFRQRIGTATGMDRLYWALRERFAHSPRHFVLQREWWDDLAQTARLIAHNIARDATGRPIGRVVAVPYSWGAGRGLTRLAASLASYGLPVDELFLIDPVPFARWNAPALLTFGRFPVPRNVHQVWCWRQCNKQGLFDPMGRAPYPRSPTTRIVCDVLMGSNANLARYGRHDGVPYEEWPHPSIRHTTIDNDLDIHRRIVNAIDEGAAQSLTPRSCI